ncbi:MAG: type IV secretory system conjugative DNA transfer family protein [Oscillibacter sp.]|nr:type IV secretory system conjugative DNA transfer family protein [Oscillibacter sp.]
MGKHDEIGQFGQFEQFNRFMSAPNKPLMMPGRGICDQLVLDAPEHPLTIAPEHPLTIAPEHPLAIAKDVALHIDAMWKREMAAKRQRPYAYNRVSGVTFGLEIDYGKGYYVGKAAEDDGHVLVVGTNGSGKSAVIAQSTLESWRDPFVALDIKGELSRQYQFLQAKWRALRSYKVFDPLDGGIHYDPYAILKKDDPRFSQYVREIADAIIPVPVKVSSDNEYWLKIARNLLSGAIAYCFCKGMDFAETMAYVQATSTPGLSREIKSFPNALAQMFVSEIPDLKPEQQAAVGTEMKNHTMVFATDSSIQDALSDDGHSEMFSWDCLMSAEAPNIFLRLSQDRLEQWSGLIRLMVTQLIRQLERRPDKYSAEGYDTQPVLVLLDEFPMLGKIDVIKSGLTTLRSKNVTFCLILQSIAQLDDVYGTDVRRIMVDNCQYKAILNVTEPDSQEYFSKLFGMVPAGRRSVSMSGHPLRGVSFGGQVQECWEPLIFPHEFATNHHVLLHTPYGRFCAIKFPMATTYHPIPVFNEIIRRHLEHVKDMGGI